MTSSTAITSPPIIHRAPTPLRVKLLSLPISTSLRGPFLLRYVFIFQSFKVCRAMRRT